MPPGRRKGILAGLTQREQQVLDVLYQHGASTSTEIQHHLDDDLSNATVRTILRALESKDHVAHTGDNNRYHYFPTEDKKLAAKKVFDKLVDTFFSGSTMDAVTTFIDQDSDKIEQQEMERLMSVIQKSKQQQDK
ncbi:BlaI/MecI/CopY family transcriptional regulator [Marinicella sp. W31]|uniref:BlaI/MecI/CopY family transcriptional regulator n=1 Tax=Marinicella sp. W31 TaxID=3023713 RepID=UPI00375737E0